MSTDYISFVSTSDKNSIYKIDVEKLCAPHISNICKTIKQVERMEKFVEKYKNKIVETFDSKNDIACVMNYINGYEYIVGNPSFLQKSELACMMGLTNNVIININNIKNIVDENFLRQNFGFFNKMMDENIDLHPNYKSIYICRSSTIFSKMCYILKNGISIFDSNSYNDITMDAHYYDCKNIIVILNERTSYLNEWAKVISVYTLIFNLILLPILIIYIGKSFGLLYMFYLCAAIIGFSVGMYFRIEWPVIFILELFVAAIVCICHAVPYMI